MRKTNLFLSVCCSVIAGFVPAAPGLANQLALGQRAKVSGAVSISIVEPVDLNFKSKASIYQMRKEEVLKHRQLLQGSYTPSQAVFGQIVDGKPWWGTIGQSYYGPGVMSIKGPAEESRFIMNPFLLAGNGEVTRLNRSLIPASSLFTACLPIFYRPTNLKWYPQAGKAEVTYEVTGLVRDLRALYRQKNLTIDPRFWLELINARDLGLNYAYVPLTGAYNVEIAAPMSAAQEIPHFIHCGGSCGYPGGCNNESPATKWLDEFRFVRLPARLAILFWSSKPSNVNQSPDMTFTINYR